MIFARVGNKFNAKNVSNLRFCFVAAINPPKLKKFKLDTQQATKVPTVAAHLVQIKAQNDEIEERIQKFMERKREEINLANVRDFCQRNVNSLDDLKESCARVDSMLIKRKDSKGHLQGSYVLLNSKDYSTFYVSSRSSLEQLQPRPKQLELPSPAHA